MKDPLGVSPSKGNQGTTQGKENFLLTSVGIEPTTSGLDLPKTASKIYFPMNLLERSVLWGREVYITSVFFSLLSLNLLI